MDAAAIVAAFLAGGLIAWALRMIWDIHRGRQKGCVNCKLYDTSLAHPADSLVCRTCGGLNVDLKNTPKDQKK